MELLLVILALAVVYVAYLRLQLQAHQREFTEFKKSIVIVPLPKKKQSPWIALFAVSTLLLACAVLLLALR
jgi:Ca2+/H+ antiporter